MEHLTSLCLLKPTAVTGSDMKLQPVVIFFWLLSSTGLDNEGLHHLVMSFPALTNLQIFRPASDATTLSSLGMQEVSGICQNWSLENIDLQGRKVSRLQGKVLIDCIKAQQELGLMKTKVSLCLPYPDEATSF